MPSTVSLPEKLESFAGLELSAVSFEWDTVLLRFVGEYNVGVRIAKAFQFRMPSEQAGRQIIPAGGGSPLVAGELALLVRERLMTITYKSHELALRFVGGQRVYVTLAAEDFDPVEISCAHHLSPNELEWYSVVNAEMSAQ